MDSWMSSVRIVQTSRQTWAFIEKSRLLKASMNESSWTMCVSESRDLLCQIVVINLLKRWNFYYFRRYFDNFVHRDIEPLARSLQVRFADRILLFLDILIFSRFLSSFIKVSVLTKGKYYLLSFCFILSFSKISAVENYLFNQTKSRHQHFPFKLQRGSQLNLEEMPKALSASLKCRVKMLHKQLKWEKEIKMQRAKISQNTKVGADVYNFDKTNLLKLYFKINLLICLESFLNRWSECWFFSDYHKPNLCFLLWA